MRTVLIVEDEWAIAAWLDAVLSDNAFHVVLSGNVRDAHAILDRQIPDLVLIDIPMPSMDGAGLLAAMAGDDRYRDIPVVAMTSLPEHVVREQPGHVRACLRKPFREADLLRVVTEIFPG